MNITLPLMFTRDKSLQTKKRLSLGSTTKNFILYDISKNNVYIISLSYLYFRPLFILRMLIYIPYLVVPDEISEVSEFILFRSCTMLKSASFEKSVFPCPISLADFRDSISLTSSSFFFTSGPPF